MLNVEDDTFDGEEEPLEYRIDWLKCHMSMRNIRDSVDHSKTQHKQS